MNPSPEHIRLDDHHKRKANWKKWGPYISDRSWGSVREDYSYDGEAWDSFPHDHSRSRAYRWGEDGIAGICDRNQYICFAIALWNEHDPILKERFFGLVPRESNHGEDLKEYYFYIDNTPTHSYMKMLYKYPQQEFPYQKLILENQRRTTYEPEYELLDTGIFKANRYFDVVIEYAKSDQEDIFIKISTTNKSAEPAPCHILPTVWFRNTWSWGYPNGPMNDVPTKPNLYKSDAPLGTSLVTIQHSAAGTYYLYADESPELLFTENDTNSERLYKTPNASLYTKDGFHRYIVNKEQEAINPHNQGTKSAAHYQAILQPGETKTIRLRLTKKQQINPFQSFEDLFQQRMQEANEFYNVVQKAELSQDEKIVQRQAFAGLLWNKQFYYFDIPQWIEGDPVSPQKPIPRKNNRNQEWVHLVNFDIISMPDKWEYPWYACWDLAFHCIPFVLIDPDFTKRQLILMTREWYQHPNGQLPAYEWNFSDVNPPVLAWAAWRCYKIDLKQTGKPDRVYLESIFHKLLLNFTWWVNQKDVKGHNVFQGGFLGLDNISIFDRSTKLPAGYIDQADGTAWMGFYCVVMMKIALELAKDNHVYQDSATKFFEHFLRIVNAMVSPERKGFSLWDEQDGFFYDVLHLPNGETTPLRIRSIIGLLPLFAVESVESELLNALPTYKERMEWFLKTRSEYTHTMSIREDPKKGKRVLLSTLPRDRLIQILRYMLDENEFLSEYGIRSLSKFHQSHPYRLYFENREFTIDYQPGDSTYRLWGGGNSNWRGPIWFPLNYLIIESLQKYHLYYGDDLKVEFPTGSGNYLNLAEVATELSKRLIALFTKDLDGKRPIYGDNKTFNENPDWDNLMQFHEFFHGDTGQGLGANHQTGWTALIAKLLQQSG